MVVAAAHYLDMEEQAVDSGSLVHQQEVVKEGHRVGHLPPLAGGCGALVSSLTVPESFNVPFLFKTFWNRI